MRIWSMDYYDISNLSHALCFIYFWPIFWWGKKIREEKRSHCLCIDYSDILDISHYIAISHIVQVIVECWKRCKEKKEKLFIIQWRTFFRVFRCKSFFICVWECAIISWKPMRLQVTTGFLCIRNDDFFPVFDSILVRISGRKYCIPLH